MNPFEMVAVTLPDPFRILWRESLGSTNDEIKILAEQGCPEGLILIAEEQTAGRGRRGAAWLSPKGENLIFSVLLRPKFSRTLWYRYSLATGLAVAKALESYVPLAQIKWPNDVWISDKKISGILIESGNNYVIIGIGLNVNSKNFPEPLNATSLHLETGISVDRAEVFQRIIQQLAHNLEQIERGFENTMINIRERFALQGSQVSYLVSDQIHYGKVYGLGHQGALLIERNGKIESIYQADEIRVISKNL